MPQRSNASPPLDFGNASEELTRGPRSTAEVRESQGFQTLRRRTIWFIGPVGFVAFAWYMGYVALGAYSRSWMSTPVFGSVNIGLLLGLAQFLSTAVITAVWVRYQRRQLAPLEATIREGGQQ